MGQAAEIKWGRCSRLASTKGVWGEEVLREEGMARAAVAGVKGEGDEVVKRGKRIG